MSVQVDKVLDAKGLSCPMPIVKAREAVKDLEPGEVLEVQATDRGSLADIQAWAKSSGHQYIGTDEDGDVLKHYLRKASESEQKGEIKYPETIKNAALVEKVNNNAPITILDVREPAEYKFGHIPGAISIPFGQLSEQLDQLNKDDEIYIVCRSGNRSDYACKQLKEAGFSKVTNVIQGMIEWTGNLTKNN